MCNEKTGEKHDDTCQECDLTCEAIDRGDKPNCPVYCHNSCKCPSDRPVKQGDACITATDCAMYSKYRSASFSATFIPEQYNYVE